MIEQMDAKVRAWIEATLDSTSVSFDRPVEEAEGAGVSAYLLTVSPSSEPARLRDRPPLKIILRYLITTWAEDPHEAHRLLGELLVQALDHSEFETEPEPVADSLWAALGAVPQPSFVLEVPLLSERPAEAAAGIVLEPLVIEHRPVERVFGRVLGPGEAPVPDAVVQVEPKGVPVRTDADGRFRAMTGTGKLQAKKIRVRHKGRPASIRTEMGPNAGSPLTIRIQSLEE